MAKAKTRNWESEVPNVLTMTKAQRKQWKHHQLTKAFHAECEARRLEVQGSWSVDVEQRRRGADRIEPVTVPVVSASGMDIELTADDYITP